MDDIVRVRPTQQKAISADEMERRRKIVRQADANNRLEGIYRGPETDAIVEAYVHGHIEVTEMITLFEAQREPR